MNLHEYIETSILPQYNNFDKAHSVEHIKSVIKQSLLLSVHYDVNIDMVYTIAAYHDLGISHGRKLHHLYSGIILMEDNSLKEFFTESQLFTMKDAIEDHRASSEREPRTIYGMIIAEADRQIDPQVCILRTLQFGLENYPDLDKEEQFKRVKRHLKDKYGEGGYLKLWIPYSNNTLKLRELRKIISNTSTLQRIFDQSWEESQIIK